MIRIFLFAWFSVAGFLLSAQNPESGSSISNLLSSYFKDHPQEKVFVTTDKSVYQPGETIWLRAFVINGNLSPVTAKSNELFVKLFDTHGESKAQGIFRLKDGSATGDLALPKQLAKGRYSLCAYTTAMNTPAQMSVTSLDVDPLYKDQWVVESKLKDSISTAGEKNEIYLSIRDLSGTVQKNATLAYQLMNGKEIFGKGKLKTDGNGKMTIPFALPAKTNGEPFVCKVSYNRNEWEEQLFLPSNLDSVVISFFPEGGSLVPGTLTKIGFTAFNRWGMPIDVEGILENQDGQSIPVRTFTRGLGMLAFEPALNQKYRLKITGKTGQNQSFALPLPNPDGVALSISKTDAEYISSALVFADSKRHEVMLTLTQGGNLYWFADLEINKSGNIKIPVNGLPHGVNLLSLLSKEGKLLANRILYIEKFQGLNIAVEPENTLLKCGENTKIKVRLTNESGQPLAGTISVAVMDKSRLDKERPRMNEWLVVGSQLETPFNLISGAYKGKITQNTLLDVFLIANRLKNFDWPTILGTKLEKPAASIVKTDPDKGFESQLPLFITGYAQRLNLMHKELSPDQVYFSANEALFQKAPKIVKTNTIAVDHQRKMLESASSIMDVIKSMKSFRIINNQIVFSGSENSINHQGGALIVLDGQQLGTDVSNIASIAPMDVDHINVSTNAMDIQKYTGLNSVGVIEIYTKRGGTPEAVRVVDVVERYDNGYRIPNSFPTGPVDPKHDTRTTLLWIPEKAVDETGLFEFSLKAGAVYSDFVVEVQGISKNGNIGTGQTIFTVVK